MLPQHFKLISEAFTEQFEFRGGEIVLHNEHVLEDVDYRTTIAQVKESEADGVYFPLIPPTSVQFLSQVEELGLDVQLLSADPLIQDVIDAAGDVTEGTYFTYISSYSEETERIKEEYTRRHGHGPLDIAMVSFGYEGIDTIIKASNSNRDDLRQGFENVIGPSRSADRIQKIFVVKDGVGVPIE